MNNFFHKLVIPFFILLSGFSVFAEMGIPLQFKLKSPSGTFPTESGLTFRVLVLTPGTLCVLREEVFSSQAMVNGNVSLALGTGTLGPSNPGLTLEQVYNNTTTKTGLSCVDANNNVISNNQTYTPGASDYRVVRVTTVIGSDSILANFNMRNVPYAIQAESVGGKTGADLLARNASTQLNQTNLDDLLQDTTRFNNLKNLAVTGAAATATTATDFTGTLAGDVTGTQGATVVGRIRGVAVSPTTPVLGQVLQFNGTQYVPSTLPAGGVISVSGHTGVVNLTTADIAGLGSAAVYNVGTAAGNIPRLDGSGLLVSSVIPSSVVMQSTSFVGDVTGTVAATTVSTVGGKTSSEVAQSVTEVQAATAASTPNALVKRDASGNISVVNVSSSSNSTNNLYLFGGSASVRVRANSGLAASYDFTLPVDAGLTGQVLQTDGAGNLSWITPATGSVGSVTASAPLSSSGGANPNISITQASGSTAGYLTSTDWSTFNNKQNSLGFTPLNPSNNLSDLSSAATARSNLGLGSGAVLSVGTAAGTLAAGDDSRIVGALQTSAYNSDLAPAASCTVSQTPYWNTVSDSWACQNISLNLGSETVNGDVSGTLSATVVNSIGGKTSAEVAQSVNDVSSATSLNTLNTIVKRDSAGDVSVSQLNATDIAATNISASDLSATTVTANDATAQNIYLREGSFTLNLKATTGLTTNLVFSLPNSAGLNGQILRTDGAGNLSWVTPSIVSGTVTGVTASAPLSSSGGANPNITIAQATASVSGYLSSTDWALFNSKQAALGFTPLNPANNLSDLSSVTTARANLGLGGSALLNVGSASGTVAAGNDARITGALQASAYASDVAPAASCTASQTPYWNTVADAWACQNIVINTASLAMSGDVTGTVSANVVENVGGKTSVSIAQTVDLVNAASSSASSGTLVRRSSSGDISVANLTASGASIATLNATDVSATSVSATSVSASDVDLRNGVYSVQLKASNGMLSNLVFALPNHAGSSGQVLNTDGAGNLSWVTPAVSASGTVTAVTASPPLASSGGATPNISMAQASASSAGYLSSSDWSTFNSKQDSLGFTPLNRANNLNDLVSVTTARANLGLGGAAVLNIGTGAGTVAAGNDTRITGALQASAYSADVAPASSCTGTQTAYWNTVADAWACQAIAFPADAVTSVAGKTGVVTLNSSDISGLGSAAGLNAGSAAGQVALLDGSARIPASALPTNALTTTSPYSGDVTGDSTAMNVRALQGRAVSAAAPAAGQALVYNGTEWVPTTGFPSFARKPTDQAFNATAVANVTGLSFNVTAGVTYKYKFQIVYTAILATTGLRLGLTYPAASVAVALANISSGADGTGAYFQGTINSSGDSVLATATSSNSANGHIAFVEGMITPTANGTVQLQAATEVLNSTITIRANSMVEITIVP